MLTFGKDIQPRLKELPKSLLLLVGMAIPIYFINVIFDTNFMFLMKAGKPIRFTFSKKCGAIISGVSPSSSQVFCLSCISPIS